MRLWMNAILVISIFDVDVDEFIGLLIIKLVQVLHTYNKTLSHAHTHSRLHTLTNLTSDFVVRSLLLGATDFSSNTSIHLVAETLKKLLVVIVVGLVRVLGIVEVAVKVVGLVGVYFVSPSSHSTQESTGCSVCRGNLGRRGTMGQVWVAMVVGK